MASFFCVPDAYEQPYSERLILNQSPHALLLETHPHL